MKAMASLPEAFDRPAPPRPASYDKKVGLVLQGGGALGSYQAGVYEALSTSDYLPDWVAGISIGAVNAAIIAGNAPEHRVERLRTFWELVTKPSSPWPVWLNGDAERARRASSINALMLGQDGFFKPHTPLRWLNGGRLTSYYDTSALKETLARLVDFDRINAREVRFSVAAVNVRTGNFAYFDNAHMLIRPEHVLASGALPPGFPAIEIDGEHYWDGGLVSNTPLQYVIESIPRRSRLTFQVDLFAARGPLPKDLEQVSEREKDIRYSSRTRAATDTLRHMHDVRHNINTLWQQLPPDLRDTPEAKFLYSFGCVTTMDIVELVYRPKEVQGHFKDCEFGRATMLERWEQGRADARVTLAASPWLEPMPPDIGARTFDVPRDIRVQERRRAAESANREARS
jgi:NTE family protein